MSKRISRRAVLRGLGVAVALPALEAMAPLRVFAGEAPKPPLRMAFFSIPNGVNNTYWFPKDVSATYVLPRTLAPLEPVKSDLLVISGLAHDKARANGDGPGDHARSNATYLTGCQARKTDGKDIRAGISVDQLAAEKIGAKTRLASIELGCEKGAMAGNCDSGYSCAYSSAISWKSPTLPMPKEINPRSVFNRLFGDPTQLAAERDRAKQAMYRRSVLDLVSAEAKSLDQDLGLADRRKLEEYLQAVRSIEKQIQASENEEARRMPAMEAPEGIPGEFPAYVKLMMDLLVVAFQSDTSRVATFVMANEGSNRTFPWIEVRDGHHSLSHHGGNVEKTDKIQRIDQFYVEQFSYFVQKLKSIPEGDGTLLDNSMIVYGGAIGDGNRHNHDELPILLAGKAQGTIATGRHVRYPRGTPLCNLFLSMLDRLGVREESFGDGTGRLADLGA
ncbi:MAG TPA: DUF1552 domain-containing protein [Planctomycetota bacterium]|jgi:hypothetical protein|nr:DUF1552 domain-containing protein [Planctomycetota bacterium]